MKTKETISETDITTQLLAKIQIGYRPAGDVVPDVVANAVRLWNVIQLARGPKPREEDKNYANYTAARGIGIEKLQEAHVNMIVDLSSRLGSKADAGTQIDTLKSILLTIQKEKPAAYDANTLEIATVIARLGGAATNANMTSKDRAGVTPGMVIIPNPKPYRGALYVQDAKALSRMVQFGKPQTPAELADKFPTLTDAQNVMQTFADISQYQWDDPNLTGKDASTYANKLYDVLGKLPSTDDLWKSGNFKTAMENLKSGNLAAGLALLKNETVFNKPVANSITNLLLVAANPMSLTTQQYGVRVKWNFPGNQDMFLDFIRGPAQYKEGVGGDKKKLVGMDPKVLYVALALHYAAMSVSGQWERMQYNPADAQSPLKPTGETGQMTGRGNAAQGQITVSTGVGILDQPMEIVFNVSGGYKEWEVSGLEKIIDGKKVTMPPVSDKTGYLGMVSLDVNFLDKEGKRARFSIMPPAAVGAGFVGEKAQNPYGYIMFSATSAEKNSWRVQAFVTPEVSYLMKELRVGGQITPLQFTRATEQYMLSLGTSSKYAYNVKNYVSTMEVSANANYVGAVFNMPLDLLARAGYAWERGGANAERVPGGMFVNMDMTIPFGRSPMSGIRPKKR